MRTNSAIVTLALASLLAAPPLDARQVTDDAVFRVFLQDGQALASYGEAVVVGDHLVFTLIVGDVGSGAPALQLMSVPLASVDLGRTMRYAEAKQALQYARTRGEADYAAVTAEVSRSLEQLMAVDDPARRLALAEDARRRLLTWSRDHFRYRAGDVRELAGLFDQVIGQLGAAAGRSRFSLDLEAGPGDPVFEPLLPSLSLRESIALALSAARETDVREERIAILRAASEVLDTASGADDLRREVRVSLEAEEAVNLAYAALEDNATARLAEARARGDVKALRALAADVAASDKALGSQRPEIVAPLEARIAEALAAAEAHQQAIDRYRRARPALVRYDRGVAPVVGGMKQLRPLLEAIRDTRQTGYAQVNRAARRLRDLAAGLARTAAPADLTRVHAAFESALRLAQQACELERQAAVTSNLTAGRSASTAAAGALMLFDRARADLAAGLRPPAVQ